PVENGKAGDLADVLTQVLGISGGQRRDRGPTLEQLHRGTTGSTPQSTSGFGSRAPGSTGGGGFGGSPFRTASMSGGGFSGGGFVFDRGSPSMQAVAPAQPQQQPPVVAPPASTPRQQARPGDLAARQGERPAEEQLRIVADQNTNTLIIYGTAQEFQNI